MATYIKEEVDVPGYRNFDSGNDSLQEHPIRIEADKITVYRGNRKIASIDMKSSKQPTASEDYHSEDGEMECSYENIHGRQNIMKSNTQVMLESYHCNDGDIDNEQLNKIDGEMSDQDDGQIMEEGTVVIGNTYVRPTLMEENNKERGKSIKRVKEKPSSKIVCEICTKSFKKTKCYSKHLATHTTLDVIKNAEKNKRNEEKVVYSCDVCKKEFPYKSVLEDHKLTHSDSRPHVCEVCGMAYKKLKYLRDHLFAKHENKNEKNVYSCDKCEKRFRYKSYFEEHIRIHTDERPFACNTCESSFKTVKHLRIHMVAQHNDVSYGDIKQHRCHVCSKVFTRPSKLKDHMITHSDLKVFVCETCGNEFKHKISLKKHMMVHGNAINNINGTKNACNITSSKLYCRFCKVTFPTNALLLEHFLESKSDGVHKVEHRIHSCHVCNKVFPNKSNLARHLMIHEVARPFKCPICGVGFKQACYIQSHMSTHQKSKCGICQLEFETKQELKKHQMRCYRDEDISVSDRKCQICGRCFENDYDFIIHKSVHERGNASFSTDYEAVHKQVKATYNVNQEVVGEQVKDVSSIDYKVAQEQGVATSSVEHDTVVLEQDKVTSIVLQDKIMTDAVNMTSHDIITTKENVELSSPQKDKVATSVDTTPSAVGLENVDAFIYPTKIFVESDKCLQKSSMQDSITIDISKQHSIAETRVEEQLGNDELTDVIPVQLGREPSRNGFKCFQCYIIYDNQEILNVHTGKYQCSVCGINFCQFEKFKSHKHYNESDQSYSCQFCKRIFQVEDNLNIHIKWHIESTDQKIHHCKVCKENFKNEKDIDRHISHHQYNMKFLCHECGEGFAEKTQLTSHKKVHGIHKCQHCGLQFYTKSSLEEHFKEEHEQKVGTRYECRYCDKTYAHRLNWRIHELHHTGEKSFSCDTCGKSFYTKELLKLHCVVHTTEKPHICQICQKGFSRVGAMKRHIRTVHKSVS